MLGDCGSGRFLVIGVVSVCVVSCLVIFSFLSSGEGQLSFSVIGLPLGTDVSVFVEGVPYSSIRSGPVLGDIYFSVLASPADSVVLLAGGRRFSLSGFSGAVVSASAVRESGGFWECIFASLIVLLLFVGWFFDFNLLGEVVVGCLVGLVWEVLTLSWWFYHGAQFIVWGFPVAVVLWWGFNLACASFLSQVFFSYSGYDFSRDRSARVLVYMVMVGIVCVPMEFLGWRVLDMWDYVWTPFWLVAVAWFLIGTLMLTVIDFLNRPFERVFRFFPVAGR